ncbi:MAG TPA: acyltransferase family protein, partial [Solirubrobacterales bacterium]|nr:acyltransferase family protein [Solirubrobacterales bacterium]
YLLIVDGVAISFYLGAPRLLRAVGARFRHLLARPLGILLLAVPTAIAIWPEASWTVASPADSYVPDLPALAYYTLFFALGATLFAHRDLVTEASRNAWRWAGCAVATAVPAGLLFTFHNSAAYGSNPAIHGAALLIYAVATWTSLIALVGLADRYLNRPRPALRWLADSSYWIYLSHMPAMVLIAALAGAMALGTAPQFVLLTAFSLAFSILTYPLFVRYTAIGRVLNGPRERRRPRLLSRLRPLPRGAPG